MNFRSSIQNKLPSLALSGLILGTSLYAVAQTDAAPPPPRGAFAHGGPEGHGHHGGGPFMHELKKLNLTESQTATIKGYVQTFREQGRSDFQAMRATHHAFETTAPGSAGYSTVVTQMSDAAATMARDRVQKEAALRAQIFSVLTDAQKSQLISALASLPERPAPPAP